MDQRKKIELYVRETGYGTKKKNAIIFQDASQPIAVNSLLQKHVVTEKLQLFIIEIPL